MRQKYFLFSITNKCNKSCDYCIAKKWVNNPQFPDSIRKDDVFRYFMSQVNPHDVVEITGGEPTTVDWLEEFVEMLTTQRVFVIIRTNGFRLFQNRYKYLMYVVNPHGESLAEEQLVKLKDTDIVIEPDIVCANEKPKFKPDIVSKYLVHEFSDMRFITADGNIRFMSCQETSIGNISNCNDIDAVYTPSQQNCRECTFALGAFNLYKYYEWKTFNVSTFR